MGEDVLDGTERLGHLAHAMGAVDEACALGRALAVGGKVEQHDAEAALAEKIGECRHERGFAGPAVHQQHRGTVPGPVGIEHVGLEIARGHAHPDRRSVSQVEPRALDERVVVGAAVARGDRRAETLEGDLTPRIMVLWQYRAHHLIWRHYYTPWDCQSTRSKPKRSLGEAKSSSSGPLVPLAPAARAK